LGSPQQRNPPLGDFLTIKLGGVPRTGGSRVLEYSHQEIAPARVPGQRAPDSARLLGESDDKKMRGHSGEKIEQKSRNSCLVNGGCIGTVDSRRNFAQS